MSNNKDFKIKNGIQPTAYHEAVGTVVFDSVGYNLTGAIYDSVSFDSSSQVSNPQCLVFNDNGTKMYILSFSPSPVLYQYSLSTAFDISTASYSNKSFSFGGSFQTANRSFMFKPDGSKMYAVGTDGEKISSYSLSTYFDVDTATLDTGTFDITAQTDQPQGMCFNSDGSKLYVTDRANDRVHQYSLSTDYDITSMSYDNVFIDVSGEDTTPRGAIFSADGTIMYLVGGVTGSVFEYSLTTAFDLSTASYSNKSFSFTGQVSGAFGVAFNSGATKMYLAGSDDIIYQYSTALTTAELDLSTGNVFEITPTSDTQVSLINPAASGAVSQATLILKGNSLSGYYIKNLIDDGVLSVASEESNPSDIQFSSDGTKFYIVGVTGDAIHQYSVATAYDINTASYDSVSFSVANEDTIPGGIFFKPDGTKLYMVGQSNDSVFQYSLSTAWDLSTTSYDSKSYSVTSQSTTARGLELNDNGTKMFILSKNDDSIYEYALSTAYDISTASLTTSYALSANGIGATISPSNLTFKPDGTAVYVSDTTKDAVYTWNLSTGFDISTASFVGFSNLIEQVSPTGLFFNSDGSKLYSVDDASDKIHQYISEELPEVTYSSSVKWGYGGVPSAPAGSTTDVITFITSDGGTSYQAVQVIDGAS